MLASMGLTIRSEHRLSGGCGGPGMATAVTRDAAMDGPDLAILRAADGGGVAGTAKPEGPFTR